MARKPIKPHPPTPEQLRHQLRQSRLRYIHALVRSGEVPTDVERVALLAEAERLDQRIEALERLVKISSLAATRPPGRTKG